MTSKKKKSKKPSEKPNYFAMLDGVSNILFRKKHKEKMKIQQKKVARCPRCHSLDVDQCPSGRWACNRCFEVWG
jgi:protein-arginine kinase activator protein McsA